MKTKLSIVLDTNVFLVSLAENYKYHWIFEALIAGHFQLNVTNEILLEYQEVIEKRYGLEQTGSTLDFLLLLPNVRLIARYFRWNLIEADKDDNKFVDCAITANADFVVSNDKHFNILATIDFPRVDVLKAKEFTLQFKEALS